MLHAPSLQGRLALAGGGPGRDRMISAAAAGALNALILYLLIAGIGARIVAGAGESMKIFDLAEPTPPPPAVPAPAKQGKTTKARTPRPEGAASPRNLRDTPKPVAAPPPVIVLPVPPPIAAAPIAGEGLKAAAGAADLPGPGTGSGGLGSGTGSGSAGNGPGGGGGGRAIPARWIRGSIDDSDYPRGAVEARASGIVYLRFTVAPSGRVSDCAVTRSSGRADLDSTTCRLIVQRFRYRPARDASGKPVPYVIRGEQDWEMGAKRNDEGDGYEE